MTRTTRTAARPGRRPGALAAAAVALLSASTATAATAGAATAGAATATSGRPAAPSYRAGSTLAEVTQQAIAESGHRHLDEQGRVTGNTVDGRATADEAARAVLTGHPRGSRAITPAAAMQSYGLRPLVTAGSGTGTSGTAQRADAGMAGMAAMTGMVAPAATAAGAPPTAPQQTTFQGTRSLPAMVGGAWEDLAVQLPVGQVQAVHSVVLSTGKVLVIAGSGNQYGQFAAGQFSSWLWDPMVRDTSTAFTRIATPYDMFCAGHVQLADGTLLIAGGTTAYPQYTDQGQLVHDWDGSKKAYVFDPRTNAYAAVGSMANARWYPGTVERSNGKVLIAGGLDDQARALGTVSHNTDSVEQYDPATRTWTGLPRLDFSTTDPSYPVPAGPPGSTRTLPYYPGLVELEDGRIFYSGESNGDNGVRPGVWDPDTGGFQSLASPSQSYTRNAGATVLLPPAQKQQVMILGGGDYATPATASTAIIDLKAVGSSANPAPHYVEGPPLGAAKMYVGAVTLPDYTVFETNGASQFRQGGVHEASVYDPAKGTMTTMNSPSIDRLYHSEALLLPSGDVAVLGSQPLDGSYELTLSLFHPTYTFTGQRPTLSGVQQLNYWGGNQGYYPVTVAAGARLAKMALLRPSATTHSTDNDQRLVDLPFSRSADGRAWTVQVPTNPALVPPGPYMMFAVDDQGRPSQALWVTVAPGR